MEKKKALFNKWCWHNWMSTCIRMKIDPYLSSCKTQVQVDQRPQYKSDHTEPDRRESGIRLQHMGTGDHFLHITPVAQTIRATMN